MSPTFEPVFSRIKDLKLKQIVESTLHGQRLDTDAALYLFKNADLGLLGSIANTIRIKKHEKRTYFNKNFHVEPTNVCLYTCSFCSYSRLIKKRSEGWEYTHEQIMDIIKSYDDRDVTEVHIVGGVLPQYDVAFYTKLFRAIKEYRPDLHIKALTPVEFHYIFKKAKVSYEEGMKMMLDAGIDSMPGGGAEIFDQTLRDKIAGGKCSADQWLDIHRIWHTLGKKSNATILYGHIESLHHRIDHMNRLRDLQDETGGFQTFIPLKFRNQNNDLSHVPEVSVIEDLKMYAMSRIFLDNFDHIKAYWPMIGRSTAQTSLGFGVNDIDGTIDDTTKIYSMAGAEEQTPVMTTREIVNLIRSIGYEPIERNSLYKELKNYSEVQFEEDTQYRGYTALPVLN